MTDTEYKIDRFDLYVTPLSPLHLGTDEDYTPTGYVMDELGLHEFDTTGAMNALMGRDTDELNRILSGKPDDSMISSIQSFFANKSDVLKGVAVNSVQVVPGVLQQYQNRVGKVANRELGGGQVRNRLEIERTAYNPVSRQSFIPGSGLKGSIRTALLNHVNQGQSLPPSLKGARGANRDFQNLLFKYKDMHQDPMRLVHIKDAVNERSGVPNRIYFCINRKRRHAKDAKDERNSSPTQRLECLIPGMKRGYRGSVSIQNLSDFKAKYSRKVPDLQFSIEDLVQACNGFYQPIWEEEIAGMQRMGYLDPEWATQSTRLLSDAASSMKSGRTFLIRLGRHSGAEAVTIDGVRQIKILQGRDKKPRYEPQATTWWMAANQEDHLNNLLPMGWALVELAKPGQTLPETNAMQDLESQYSGDFEQWSAKVQGQRDLVMERISKKLEDQRKRDEEQAAKAREQAERKAFRSQMSEEQRQIEDLREQFVQEKAAGGPTPNGELAQNRVSLLKSALEWDDETLRKDAHSLLKEIVKALPWSKKSKKERQEQMRKLSGQ